MLKRDRDKLAEVLYNSDLMSEKPENPRWWFELADDSPTRHEYEQKANDLDIAVKHIKYNALMDAHLACVNVGVTGKALALIEYSANSAVDPKTYPPLV